MPSTQPERQHYKNAQTQNVPHSRTHGRAPLKAGFPLALIRSADLAHLHPPRFHICNYHWKSHTSGTALELRSNFPMTGQELIKVTKLPNARDVNKYHCPANRVGKSPWSSDDSCFPVRPSRWKVIQLQGSPSKFLTWINLFLPAPTAVPSQSTGSCRINIT